MYPALHVLQVDSEPLLKQNDNCKDFIIEAMKYHLLKVLVMLSKLTSVVSVLMVHVVWNLIPWDVKCCTQPKNT